MFFTKQNITLLQLKQAPLPFNSFNYSVKPRTNKNWTYISRWSMHFRTGASRLDIQYKITYDIPLNHVIKQFF